MRVGLGCLRISKDDDAPIRAAWDGGIRITSLADAQVNVVSRMLEKYGALLGPEEMKQLAKKDPNTLAPNALFRMVRDLEVPAEDEGFSEIETVPFVRDETAGLRPGIAIPFELLGRTDIARSSAPDTPLLVFAWRPPADAARIVEELADGSGRTIDLVRCHHGEGPPVCWCRPPLPGAWLWFERRRNVGREGSKIVAATSTHRQLAQTLGLATLDVR